jgi:hypothetical protein
MSRVEVFLSFASLGGFKVEGAFEGACGTFGMVVISMFLWACVPSYLNCIVNWCFPSTLCFLSKAGPLAFRVKNFRIMRAEHISADKTLLEN